MFDINDYYLGLIFANFDYFDNQKALKRLYLYADADPFYNMRKENAIVTGNVVLLRKENDRYYDEDHSLYKNELYYKLGEMNDLGIFLIHVKPFKECFHEKVNIYILEEVYEDEELMEEMISHSYYVVYDKTTKEYAVIINVDSPLEIVRNEYFKQLLGPELYDDLINHKLRLRL